MVTFRFKISTKWSNKTSLPLNFDYYLAVCITVLKAARQYVRDGHGCVQTKSDLQEQVGSPLPQLKNQKQTDGQPQGLFFADFCSMPILLTMCL